VVIGGEMFYPVASSASQQKYVKSLFEQRNTYLIFRDRSIWFINPRMIDGQALRAWMGNVEETIVAKHAARMGLVRHLG
jgi:RNA-dependent RNA polymerase